MKDMITIIVETFIDVKPEQLKDGEYIETAAIKNIRRGEWLIREIEDDVEN